MLGDDGSGIAVSSSVGGLYPHSPSRSVHPGTTVVLQRVVAEASEIR